MERMKERRRPKPLEGNGHFFVKNSHNNRVCSTIIAEKKSDNGHQLHLTAIPAPGSSFTGGSYCRETRISHE